MDENIVGEERSELERKYHEFASLAVHDLDSPLRKLGVFIEKLSGEVASDNNRATVYINRINSCLLEMRTLINSLSEFSSLDVTKRYVSCDMGAILEEVLSELKPIIEKKNATIRSSSLPVVRGIQDQYQLLFKKLLENALKFSRADVPLIIEIDREEVTGGKNEGMTLDKNTNWYKITIRDNGIGFCQEDADKIFEPFARLHGKSAFPGSGLGLTIVKKIIDQHGGKIFAESTEDAGSRFIIIIPENPQ